MEFTCFAIFFIGSSQSLFLALSHPKPATPTPGENITTAFSLILQNLNFTDYHNRVTEHTWKKLCQGHVRTLLGPLFTLIYLMENIELCNVQGWVILNFVILKTKSIGFRWHLKACTIFGTIQGHILAMLGPGLAWLYLQATLSSAMFKT